MHTSKLLQSKDFQYWQIDAHTRAQITTDTLYPNYHAQDRIGVVAPGFFSAAFHTSYALLALTTSFYDVYRARGGDFFDYPHHFALFDITHTQGMPRQPDGEFDLTELCGPWSALDVWPSSNWIPAPATVGGMLKKVFDWQINRLFWPEDFRPISSHTDTTTLPIHIYKILNARLKTVYYYQTDQPTIEIRATQAVEDVWQRSRSRLPQYCNTDLPRMPSQGGSPELDAAFPYVRQYRQVDAQAFLTTMQPLFASDQ